MDAATKQSADKSGRAEPRARLPLVVEPESWRFNSVQEDKLVELLERTDRSTDLIQITSEDMVRMNANGVIGAGFRLTPLAFSQVCKAVCPGLYRMLVELNSAGTPEAQAASVAIVNQLVRLNFRARLASQLFLCNRQTSTVEAVVSPDYRLLPNLILFQRLRAMLASLPFETAFFEAVLNGRWLMIRYYRKESLFEHRGSRFFGGYHLSNHEGGQASVHAAIALICEHERLVMLTPFTRDHTARHIGRKFEARFGDMLARLAQHRHQAEVLESGVEALSEQSLGLGHKEQRVENARRRELVRRLCGFKHESVPKPLMGRIVTGMITQPFGASKPKPMMGIDTQELVARTAWDLAVAASREAKKCSIATRELVEQIGMALVMGRLKLGTKPAEV